jgi:flagellar protein FlaG
MATDISIQFHGAVPASGNGPSAWTASGTAPAASRPVAAPAVGAAVAVDEPRLEALTRSFEQLAAEHGAELSFRVDEDSGRVIVSVLDRADGTVLRQMPSEEALHLARTLAQRDPQLISAKA